MLNIICSFKKHSETLLCVELQGLKHTPICSSVCSDTLLSLPTKTPTPARTLFPPQQTFPGKCLYEAAILPKIE